MAALDFLKEKRGDKEPSRIRHFGCECSLHFREEMGRDRLTRMMLLGKNLRGIC